MRYYLIRACIILMIIGSKELVSQNNRFDYLIFPDTSERIIIVKENKTDFDTDILSGERCDTGNYIKMIMNELNFPFHKSMIRINQCSRNINKDTNGPNILFVSNNEGGFPRQGIEYYDHNKLRKYPLLNFVDLVIRDYMFYDGALDIYSHELGHVMMNNIWPVFPDCKSMKQHLSMGLTDCFVAFYEGWGIHFQRLAYENIPIYRTGFENIFYFKRIDKLWHSKIDQILRINGVLNNSYIFRKLLPQNLNADSLNKEDLILAEHTSPIFDQSKLKNAQEMLSCEGVIATLFYHINTNSTIQHNFLNKEFYENFLISKIPTGVKPEEIFSPLENILLKNLYVFNKIKKNKFSEKQIFIEYIKEWCLSFPEDKESLLDIFIFITVGKTINNDLGLVYEKMSGYGSIGNYKQYKALNSLYYTKIENLRNSIYNDIDLLSQNIGPQLWAENSNLMIKTTLWSDRHKKPLYININTASLYDIFSFEGYDLKKASLFIKKRDELTYFKSFKEAEEYGFIFE